MSRGIFYNQSVTANDLNEIATDLGATSFNGFGTEKFGASELNNITKDLVGKGYLNVKNKCKPTVSADGSKIIVQSGIVVFENGAKKVIENTLEISFGVGRKYYFLNEISNGLCSLWWSTVGYPSEGDYVPLCEVTSDGTLIDKRVFSVAKVNLGAVENNKTLDMEYTFDIYKGKAISGTLPLDFTGYNGILARYIWRNGGWDTFSHKDKEDTFVTIPASGWSEECFSMQSTTVFFERTATGLNYRGGTSWSSGHNDLRLKVTLF